MQDDVGVRDDIMSMLNDFAGTSEVLLEGSFVLTVTTTASNRSTANVFAQIVLSDNLQDVPSLRLTDENFLRQHLAADLSFVPRVQIHQRHAVEQ